MGRLPDYFAQRRITYREPYAMEARLRLTTGATGQQYPEAAFMHATDKPFEVHRMIPRLRPLNANNNPVDEDVTRSNDYLMAMVRARFNDLGKTIEMTKAATPLRSLVKGTAEQTWEFAEPAYLAKGESYQIELNADTFPGGFADDAITQIEVSICFEGFQLIVAPASDNR